MIDRDDELRAALLAIEGALDDLHVFELGQLDSINEAREAVYWARQPLEQASLRLRAALGLSTDHEPARGSHLRLVWPV